MPQRYRPRDVVRVLESFGWQQNRQRGSHLIMVKPGVSYNISIPMSQRELKRGMFGQILRKAGISRQEFDSRI
ncbi:MAG: type II toxin-antitoxin system HicA family toxin [Chloroflexi bacterium]|nr:type II toxin-antitoxin system HicA family toxin [Chloroflexota bacterium]